MYTRVVDFKKIDMSHQVLPSSTLENHQLTQNKVKASHFTHNFTDTERERERERG